MVRTSGLDARAELQTAAASGLMALAGEFDGPPLCPPGLVRGLDRLAARLARWSSETGAEVAVDGAELVTARAALLGLRRQGPVSAGGTCRILPGPGGYMALNLARPDDYAAVDAIANRNVEGDPWEAVAHALTESSVADVVARARLLGVPAAPLSSVEHGAPPWSARRCWPRGEWRAIADLHIVDLSSMWAGPLGAMLLAQAGGLVVKVESTSRPDGARAEPAFYASLHADGQRTVALDFATAEGRRQLRALVEDADVVIESSRPRALEQLGAGPDDVGARPGRVWLSITGYGRNAPGRDWVAFGDDAAVAGGLVAWTEARRPVFCGDALADPVTGMIAAAAVMEAIAGGGGVLLDVSMAACAAALASEGLAPAAAAERDERGWHVVIDDVRVPVRDRAEDARPTPEAQPAR